MKTIKTLATLVFLSSIALCPLWANAAKENFDRSKPHVNIAVNIGGADFGAVAGLKGLGFTPAEDPATGGPRFGNITLKRGYTGSTELHDWALSAAQQGDSCRECRKDITINMLSRSGEVVRTFNLIDAFPVKWEIGSADGSSSVAVETVEVRVNRIEMQ